MVRKLILVVGASTALVLTGGASAFAANPGTQGQPSQSCQNPATSTTPGNASSASGSAFNPNGTAGGVYAGNQAQSQKNPNSVSQYDVACFQNSQQH
jgi:hypothetical protein